MVAGIDSELVFWVLCVFPLDEDLEVSFDEGGAGRLAMASSRMMGLPVCFVLAIFGRFKIFLKGKNLGF